MYLITFLHTPLNIPSSDQYSVCVSLSILKLDLNVKHWYKNIDTIYFIVSRLVVTNFHVTFP